MIQINGISDKTIINNKNNNKSLKINNFIYLEKLEKRAKSKLIKRYSKPIWYYETKMINDILYNEKTHYVGIFKEFLIYEDYNEFLKKYYKEPLLKAKLQKILIFYEKYSKIFPNYTVVRESKYLYKNIKRKQKMINQMNEIQNYEDLEDENYSDSQSYYKTIFNSRVINSIYTGHNTINLNKTNSTLADNKSVENFLDKITYFEKKAKEEKEKNSKNKSKKKEEKNKMNKNEEPNINKNNSNLFVNSILTPSNNSFLKNKINKYIKKNILDNYLNNAINNNKLMFKQINIITKQKSFSNFVSNNNNKKIYASIKHNNFIKKNKNYYNYSSIEPNILLSKQNISNILNNISESYRSNSNNNINMYFDFDKY